ncbi:MAG: phosphate signaling complex PhoU family protein [Acidimicrobiales bacterium]
MTAARPRFHERVTSLERAAVSIGREVHRSIADATDAWLRRDRVAGSAVDARTAGWSGRAVDLELSAYELLATQQPMATDLRRLTALVRLTEAVARSGDLVAHVGRSACFDREASAFTPTLRALVVEMAAMTAQLYGDALGAYEQSNAVAGQSVVEADQDLDALRNELLAVLIEQAVAVVPAIDLALLGRFYERVGDHAVDIASLASFVATGRYVRSTFRA